MLSRCGPIDGEWRRALFQPVRAGGEMVLDVDDPMQASVDHLDSTRGHVKANCKLSCLGCNVSKKDKPL